MGKFWIGVLVGLAFGAGVGVAGFFTMNEHQMIRAGLNQDDVYRAAESISSKAIDRMWRTANPVEVTQVAAEATVLLNFAQVRQNDIMLKKLDTLIEQSKSR
ncbi:MAG: hypothetical protein SFU83_20740 [Meiothermus sp.]|nr:hypothetical protein [Meiothermus sp.]